MSHDKKKSKKVVDTAHVPTETKGDTAKGSGDAKTGAKNAVPDTKADTKKGSKSKKR